MKIPTHAMAYACILRLVLVGGTAQAQALRPDPCAQLREQYQRQADQLEFAMHNMDKRILASQMTDESKLSWIQANARTYNQRMAALEGSYERAMQRCRNPLLPPPVDPEPKPRRQQEMAPLAP
jgi:hypothetical protein